MSAADARPAGGLPDGSWDGIGVSVAEIVDQLAHQRRPDGGPPLTLAGVLNLVAYVPDTEDVSQTRAVIERLADHQPSRAVLVVESDAGAGIDATVSTSCRLTGEHLSVGLELVVLTLHGDGRAGAASAIVPLLRSDLPTFLWWPGSPDLDPRGPLARLAPLADRIITETERRSGGVARLAAWAADAPAAVTDLAWAAITPWRQLIAQMLGAADLARASIAHHPSGPSVEALLLAGWLRSLPGNRRDVALRPRPGAPAAALGIEIATAGLERRISIDHMPERQAATVRTTDPGGAIRERVLPLPASDRSRLLAGELEVQRRDRAFERALARAA